MNTTIHIEIKNVYGRDTMYVISEHKEAIRMLTGHTSITDRDVEALKLLGFHIVEPAQMGKLH